MNSTVYREQTEKNLCLFINNIYNNYIMLNKQSEFVRELKNCHSFLVFLVTCDTIRETKGGVFMEPNEKKAFKEDGERQKKFLHKTMRTQQILIIVMTIAVLAALAVVAVRVIG